MNLLNLALAASAVAFSLSATSARAENIKYDMPKHPRVLTVTTADGTITAAKLEKALRVSSGGETVTGTELILSFNQLFRNMVSSTEHMIVKFSVEREGKVTYNCDVTYREESLDSQAASFENCSTQQGLVIPNFYVSRQALLGVSKDRKF